jgi:hypothetical protein
MEKEPKKKILVWFDLFDSLINNPDKEERAQAMFDEVDLVYAQKNSYQSACERVYSNKVHKLPAYVNNDDAVQEYAKEREEEDIILISPMDALARILNKDMKEIERIFTKMMGQESDEMPNGMPKGAINLANLSPEELEKELPKPIAKAFQGLHEAIAETSNQAQTIIAEYMEACNVVGIDEDQAQTEGQSYVQNEGKIPAAEFICPVGILDRLDQI